MKFTNLSANRLVFNDLGSDIRGVSEQAKLIALNAGESIYLADQSGVLYSATKGDAYKFAKAGLLQINDVALALADAAVMTLVHNFGILPIVTVAKLVTGVWEPAVVGTDVTVTTTADLKTTLVTNISGGVLDIQVRIS